MTQDPQPDPKLASQLRETAGAEWTAEAAEDERLTELLRRRRLTLSDFAKEMANRGERVSVEFGGHSFTGAIIGAGDDYVTVQGPGQIAEIALAQARWSILNAEGPSVQAVNTAPSFRAALHEHAAAETNIRLTLDRGDMVIGKVAVVATDHLEFSDVDERRIYVPMEIVLGTIRSIDSH
jgi:uncharacterized RmlC-like cupin family protein